MLKKSIWLSLAVSLPLTFLLGCMGLRQGGPGRVLTSTSDKRTVTIIRDKRIAQNPDYSYLPPLTYVLPTDPVETGPEPKAGGRIKLDTEKNQIVIFDAKTQNFKTIDFKVVEKKEWVASGDPAIQGKSFPVIDKGKQTVTIYSGRQKILETISVPEEYLTLPPSTWDAGDEVRIYYKQEGKALRFMNISRTDIFKK
jgi:hypothetical protein